MEKPGLKQNMMRVRKLLGLILLLCCGFMLFAFYLQHYRHVLPCPLCVLQRYAFVAIILFCLIGRITPFVRLSSLLALVSSAGGAFAASSQIWAVRKNTFVCAKDSMEILLNGLFPAKWFPSVFKAQGACGKVGPGIWGLSLPEWSLIWFMLFSLVFFIIVLRYRN